MNENILKKPVLHSFAAALLTLFVYSLPDIGGGNGGLVSLVIFFPMTLLSYLEDWKWAFLGYGILFSASFLIWGNQALVSAFEIVLMAALMAYMLKKGWAQFHVFLISALFFAAINIGSFFLMSKGDLESLKSSFDQVTLLGKEALIKELESRNMGADVIASAMDLYQSYIRLLTMSIPAILVGAGLLIALINVSITKNLAFKAESYGRPFLMGDYNFSRPASTIIFGLSLIFSLIADYHYLAGPLAVNFLVVLFMLALLNGFARINDKMKGKNLPLFLRIVVLFFSLSFVAPALVLAIYGLIRGLFSKSEEPAGQEKEGDRDES